MGVTGLWKLIEPVGKPIPLESLENKVLAVDVSIWLYQLTKGIQTTGGGAMPNAHIIGLFSRICKLLYYRIKPIFVFDGGVPVLKKETMEMRRKLRRKLKDSSEELREKLLNNLMKQKAVNKLLGADAIPSTSRQEESDIFALPPLPEEDEDMITSSDEDGDTEMTTAKVESMCDYMYGKDVHSIDINSEQFRSLPPEMRHELLSELIETRKQSSWGCYQEMKKDSNFSDYQMKRLVKRRNVQRSLDEAAKEMGGRMMTLGELENMFREDGIVTDSLPGRRIAKDCETKFIYVMGDEKSSKKINDKKSEPVVSNETSVIPPAHSSESPSKKVMDEDEFRNQSFQIDQSIFIRDSSSEDEFLKNEESFDDYAQELSKEEELPQEEILRIIKMRQAVIRQTSTSSSVSETLERSQNISTAPASLNTSSVIDAKTDLAQPITESRKLPEFCSENNSLHVTKVSQTFLPDSAAKIKVSFSKTVEDREEQSLISKDYEISRIEEIKLPCDQIKDSSLHLDRKPMENETSVELMDDSDSSDDFIEVNSNSTEIKSGTIEIDIDPNRLVDEEDIFADVFLDDFNEDFVSSKTPVVAERAIDNTEEEKEDGESKDDLTVLKIDVVNTKEQIIEDVTVSETREVKQETDLKNDHKVVKMVDLFQKAREAEEKKTPTKNHELRKTTQSPYQTPTKSQELNKTTQSPDSKVPEKDDKLLTEQRKLYEEELQLQSEFGKQERLGSTISQQMIIEAQELLRMFGLPYLIAPMEAEAQCAFLDQNSLTDGTITDDSDIWLFGGRNVYKNFFDNHKFVLQFRNLDIEHFFKLSREQLIQMALLVGSDYTVGIEGVGPVTAIEILAYFSNKANKPETEADIADALRKFKGWIETNRNKSSVLSRKVKNVQLSEEFPSMHVIEAYLYPTVDDSRETFTWAAPDLDRIRVYMKRKLAWKTSRIDDILLPVMKRLNNRQRQTTLDAFFKAKPYQSIDRGHVSERVIRAINIMKNKVEVDVAALPTKSPRKKTKSKTGTGSQNTKSTPKKRPQSSKNLLKAFSPTKPSTSLAQDKIPQREKSLVEAAKRKMEAAEILRKSRKNTNSKKKRGTLQPKADSSYLSESSTDED